MNNKLSIVELVDRKKGIQQYHGTDAEYVINKFFGYMNFFHPEENFEQNSVELLFKELRNKKNSFIKISDFNSKEEAKRYFSRLENNLTIYDTFKEPLVKHKIDKWKTFKMVSQAVFIFLLTISVFMLLLYLIRS
ncbi:hypothetical protein WJ970_08650 [Achromobacter xylosoxidans]